MVFLFPLQFQIAFGRCIISAAWPSLLVKRITGIFLIFVEFILPLIILSYCYERILFVLTRRVDSNLSTGNLSDQFQLARKNTIKTFLIVAICFVMCWSNNQIYFLMHNLGYDINWDGVYCKFTIFMVFLNCTVNPFVYLIKYRDYQKALRSMITCNRQKREEELTSTVTTISTLVNGTVMQS